MQWQIRKELYFFRHPVPCFGDCLGGRPAGQQHPTVVYLASGMETTRAEPCPGLLSPASHPPASPVCSASSRLLAPSLSLFLPLFSVWQPCPAGVSLPLPTTSLWGAPASCHSCSLALSPCLLEAQAAPRLADDPCREQRGECPCAWG